MIVWLSSQQPFGMGSHARVKEPGVAAVTRRPVIGPGRAGPEVDEDEGEGEGVSVGLGLMLVDAEALGLGGSVVSSSVPPCWAAGAGAAVNGAAATGSIAVATRAVAAVTVRTNRVARAREDDMNRPSGRHRRLSMRCRDNRAGRLR